MDMFLRSIGKHRFSFLSMPGVVSVGLGIKVTRNVGTGRPSLVIGVEKKLQMRDIPDNQRIPHTIDGLPTDVIETGKIKFLGFALPNPAHPFKDQPSIRTQRVRPAQPGVSIAHYKVTAGTFGALVKGDFPGGTAILSNNHILANGTSGNDGLSRIGDPVLQPGPYDKGSSQDMIARLHAFSPMIPEEKSREATLNKIDAALAIPIEAESVKSPVLGLGTIRTSVPAYPGMMVFKSGRSSGITRGFVFSVGNTIRVESDNKKYLFEDQIGTTTFSEGGDSGSLLVNRYGRAVGLLFAGAEKQSFSNPIDRVFEYFGISLFDS